MSKVKKSKGLTLLELVVAMGIFSVVLTLCVVIITTFFKTQRLTGVMKDTQQNSRSVIESISKETRNAESFEIRDTNCASVITTATPTGPCLKITNTDGKTVQYSFENPNVVRTEGPAPLYVSNLNSTNIKVSNLSFIKISDNLINVDMTITDKDSSDPFGRDSTRIQETIYVGLSLSDDLALPASTPSCDFASSLVPDISQGSSYTLNFTIRRAATVTLTSGGTNLTPITPASASFLINSVNYGDANEKVYTLSGIDRFGRPYSCNTTLRKPLPSYQINSATCNVNSTGVEISGWPNLTKSDPRKFGYTSYSSLGPDFKTLGLGVTAHPVATVGTCSFGINLNEVFNNKNFSVSWTYNNGYTGTNDAGIRLYVARTGVFGESEVIMTPVNNGGPDGKTQSSTGVFGGSFDQIRFVLPRYLGPGPSWGAYTQAANITINSLKISP